MKVSSSHSGEIDLVAKAGATYKMGDTKLGVGYDASRTFLHDNKDVAKELLKQIKRSSERDKGSRKRPLSLNLLTTGLSRSVLYPMVVISIALPPLLPARTNIY